MSNSFTIADDSDAHSEQLWNDSPPASRKQKSPVQVIDLTESPPRPPKRRSPSPLLSFQSSRARYSSQDDDLHVLPLESTRAANSQHSSPPASSPPRNRYWDDEEPANRETHSDPETPQRTAGGGRGRGRDDDDDDDDELLAPMFFSSQPVGDVGVRKSAKELAAESQKRKAEERTRLAAAKEREKHQRREEKQKTRKRTKEEAAAEMSVILDRRIIDEKGAEILAQLQKICEAATGDLPVPGLIQWRRKETRQLEKAVVLRMRAGTWADKASNGHFKPMIMQLQQHFAMQKVILLLEGFQELLRLRQRQANAAYRGAVDSGAGRADAVLDHSSIKQLRELLDESVLWLEVERHCQVWQTDSAEQSAMWLCTLTTQLGLLPYKPKPSFDSFCAEAAPKKSYATPKELWEQQLQCLNGISSDIAQAISAQYPTITSLLRLYSSSLSDREKRDLLRNLPLRGADGLAGTRRVGQAISEKIYRLFTSTRGDEVL